MATGFLREWRSAAIVNGTVTQVPSGDPLRAQVCTFTTTTQFTNAIGADCELVELWADAAACFALGTNPTATLAPNGTTDKSGPLSAGTHFFWKPSPGGTTKVALIVIS